jgi:hypothetical protein
MCHVSRIVYGLTNTQLFRTIEVFLFHIYKGLMVAILKWLKVGWYMALAHFKCFPSEDMDHR